MKHMAREGVRGAVRVVWPGTGLKVSALILGTALLGKARGYGADPEDVPAILRAYADAGGNFIDTSDAYQEGQAEVAVGDFVIASKYGRAARPQPPVAARGGHRKAMVQSVEASPRRLKTDRIDLAVAAGYPHDLLAGYRAPGVAKLEAAK